MSIQISTFISNATKEKMEHYSETYGFKKGFLIETALEHFFQAMAELPSNAIVPNNIILDAKNFEAISSNEVDKNSNLKKLIDEK